MAILWPSTVDFELRAKGGKVRSACPARCPNPPILACIPTLLPLTFCAGPSVEKCGGSRVGLHMRRISSSFDAQGSLGAFPPHILKLFRPETHLHLHRWLERATLAGDQKQFLDTHLK